MPRRRVACPDEPTADRTRQRRMRAVDFTRPTKFTAEQERRIKRALDTFCRTASTRLSAELRMSLELEVINVNQLTWSNAHAQVPPRSISCTVESEGAGTRMLLSAEMNLILSAIELLLGGSGDHGAARAPADGHRLGPGPPLPRPAARRSCRSSGRT